VKIETTTQKYRETENKISGWDKSGKTVINMAA
jgi:hypothetical protein